MTSVSDVFFTTLARAKVVCQCFGIPDDVARAISDFIPFGSQWSLRVAGKRNISRLIQLLHARTNPDDPSFATLARVQVVCRAAAVPQAIARHISDFIASKSSWTVVEAGEYGYPRLMRLLLAQANDIDSRYVAHLVNRFIDIAIGLNDVQLVEDYLRFFPHVVTVNGAVEAVRRGHPKILRVLYDYGHRVCWNDDILQLAVEHGHLFVAQLIHEWFKHQTIQSRLCYKAVLKNDVKFVKWLWPFVVVDGDEDTQFVSIEAAPIRLAKWMLGHTFVDVPVSIDVATRFGDLVFIRWAEKGHVAVAKTKAMDAAAARGHRDTVQWLHLMRREGCTTAAIDEAARGGHADIIKFLLTSRSEGFTSRALDNAAVEGHLSLLIELHGLGTAPIPCHTFDRVCERGHRHVAEWLTSIGHVGATTQAMDLAAANGHMSVVLFLSECRTEGCTTDAMDVAASKGDLIMVRWLHENRHEGCTTGAMDGAAANGHMEVLEYLLSIRKRCSPDALARAARRGFLTIMYWLHANCFVSFTPDVMDAAISIGDLKIVRWIRENGYDRCTSSGFDDAIVAGDFETMDYVRRTRLAVCSGAAFRRAVHAGKLYEAAWMAHFFPEACDDMEHLYARNGWTRVILELAGLGIARGLA